MNPKSSISPPSLLFLFFFLFYSTTALNITKMLGQYPDFSSFNDYLTQTQLADEINSRQTITVLAVDNSAMSPLSGKSTDVVKKIMSLHVVLDYFDLPKLQKLSKKTSILTTLLQSSGQATGQQGFLNVTDLSTGGVAFGSAVAGSALGANLVKAVVTQPYNISVLQISTVIMPAGIGNSNSNSTSSPPAPAATPTKSPAPAVSTPAKSPSIAPPTSGEAPAPSVAKTPSAAPPKSEPPSVAQTPSASPPSGDSSATPSDAPSNASPPSDASAPSDADAPSTADAPLGSPPSPSIASGPTADSPTGMADVPAPEGDPSGTPAAFGIHLALIIMVVVSSTWSLTPMM